MCVGVPMKVLSAEGLMGQCQGPYGEEAVSFALTGTPEIGSHVLVFLGSAVRTISAGEATEIENALKAVAAAARGEDFEALIADLVDREPELPPHLRQ